MTNSCLVPTTLHSAGNEAELERTLELNVLVDEIYAPETLMVIVAVLSQALCDWLPVCDIGQR